jgi:hypothetical protein
MEVLEDGNTLTAKTVDSLVHLLIAEADIIQHE